MDRQQIGLKLAIDALGLPFQISSFQDRLILQKSVYLAQAASVDLGYYHHWYLHGPYCSALTGDAFAVVADIASELDESNRWKLDDTSCDRLKGLQSFFSSKNREELAGNLELLASVHFLIDRNQVKKGDVEGITTILKRYNKPYTKNQVRKALEELTNHALLKKRKPT
jgi:uncharacterized protein YwgA